jgi:GNAT superfamily N-acetyltransferase
MPAIAGLACKLALQHKEYDVRRFHLGSLDELETNHVTYLTGQFLDERSVFLVAESDGEIAGYAFLQIVPENFIALLEEGVWLHDIYFDESIRGRGFGKRFFKAVVDEAKKLGSGYLMLEVSTKNAVGQEFFTKMGFRPTMLEMRLDLDS